MEISHPSLKTIAAISAVLLVLLVVVFQLRLGFIEKVLAAAPWNAPLPLTGYIWSGTADATNATGQTFPTGLGWISLNCNQPASGGSPAVNTCATVSYKVQINTNKTLTGLGWIGGGVDQNGVASPGGWVQFGGVGCPAGNIDTDGNCAARVIGSNTNGFEFTGWARALSYSDPQAGGWDGWISLNCENTNTCSSGVNYQAKFSNTGVFPTDSYAWGADVLGRMGFSFAKFAPACTVTTTNTCLNQATSELTGNDMWCSAISPTQTACTPNTEYCNFSSGLCEPFVLPTGTLTIAPTILRSGSNANITWTVVGSANVCTVTGGGLNGTGVTSPAGGLTTQPVINQVTVTLTCDGITLDSKTIRVIPAVYES